MELQELRRRLVSSKPSSAATDDQPAEELKQQSQQLKRTSAAAANPEAPRAEASHSSKKREADANDAEPIRSPAASPPGLSAEEIKNGELAQAREILSISEPLHAKPKLVEAVDKVFRPMEKFRDHFARLARLFEPVDEASRNTLDSFRKIGDLQAHLAELCKTFQLVRAFTDQVGKVAETFDPMKPLHEQLAQLNDAFYANLADLVQSLEPVDALKARTAQLYEALEVIGELKGKLKEVAQGFHPANGGQNHH